MYTTEITSESIVSDNPIHQRLFFAYIAAEKHIQGKLLEIGCGTGRGLEVLLPKSTDYTGIDKNKKILDTLKAKYPQANFITQNIPPLKQIEDNTFDTVVTFQVIEHIKNDDLFIKEIHRVLKKGGKAIFTTPNIKYSLTRNPWHIREYTAEELQNLLNTYFANVDTKGVQGNSKVMTYYEENKKSVAKFKKLDIFNLEYRLPRSILQIPYDILNRVNRKKLQKQSEGLVSEITHEDYLISNEPDKSLDFFYIAEK